MKKTMTQIMTGLMALFIAIPMAFAISVETAKQQGLVGERADGLLGIVSGATPEVKQMVDQTNADRMNKYRAIATKNGTDVSQVQALAGKKLIEKAAPGEYIQNAGGGWQKK